MSREQTKFQLFRNIQSKEESIEEKREKVRYAIDNSEVRCCPFCLDNISKGRLLGHIKCCMYIWEEETDCGHFDYVKHAETHIENETKKRKFEH